MLYVVGASAAAMEGHGPRTIFFGIRHLSTYLEGVAFNCYNQTNSHRQTCVNVDKGLNIQARISSQLSTPRKDLFLFFREGYLSIWRESKIINQSRDTPTILFHHNDDRLL